MTKRYWNINLEEMMEAGVHFGHGTRKWNPKMAPYISAKRKGRLPSQRLDPALPKLFWFTPTFPTCPTVAEQFFDIKRTSPEGNFNVADFPSFAISFATAPAALPTDSTIEANDRQ
ncbi:hypothetical protein RJ640_012563 [Escallonia rubra]|uniref:Uncharacterized protein ycf72 n=1 Tax=Escallonia rubra TaxID=112253 RepID=A0AA88Q7L9_9ASTE|nr:hypothetical protein RJ640_012563 [Escallonia rubra]